MPLLNWEPEGSFLAPISPPLLGPTGGTLVCIPPLNKDWLKIILGCLDQLRIPATWKAVDRADLLQALNWMQQLKDVVASAGPCCDVAMRLTATCVLQFSKDGGSTWIDVTDWSTNFCTCVTHCIVAPVPPNPGPSPIEQHACNIAGFLASKIIQTAMVKVVAYVGTTGQQLQFATDVLATIGYAFPITYAAALAFNDWYNSVVGQVLAQVSAASTDPTLWSTVTCAIYSAIKTVGYVDASNFAAVHTNLAAMSYTYAWVPPVIAAWWNDMGLVNIEAAQNVGALDVVDCTNCGTFCYRWDFTTVPPTPPDWSIYTSGVFVPGVGWHSVVDGAGRSAVDIQYYFPHPIHINTMSCGFFANNPSGGQPRAIYLYSSGSLVFTGNMPSGGSGIEQAGVFNPGVTADRAILRVYSADGTSTNIIVSTEILGNGPNPWGPDNC